MSAPETWPGEKSDDDGEAVGGYEDVTGGAVDDAQVDLDEEIEPEDDDELDEDEEDEPDELGTTTTSRPSSTTTSPRLRLAGQHAPGELNVPDDVDLLEGESRATRRGVGIVAARFNGEVTNLLLESAFAELDKVGVGRETVTVMTVPGAFELPLGAMALAKTRRYSCIVALGCVIRGETAHFEYVSGEAASGLQLAALETGVPVAFGVLTVDTLEQALARADKGAEAVRTALEMADVFSQLRATAQATEHAAAAAPRHRLPLPSRGDVQDLLSLREEAGFGQHRSHSMVASKRRFNPNLQKIRIVVNGTAKRAVRLHALPQGRQDPKSALERSATPLEPYRSNSSVESGHTLSSELGRITISSDAIAHIVGRDRPRVLRRGRDGRARPRRQAARPARAPDAGHPDRPGRRRRRRHDRPPRHRRVRSEPGGGRIDRPQSGRV